jgi:hypothetical protein
MTTPIDPSSSQVHNYSDYSSKQNEDKEVHHNEGHSQANNANAQTQGVHPHQAANQSQQLNNTNTQDIQQVNAKHGHGGGHHDMERADKISDAHAHKGSWKSHFNPMMKDMHSVMMTKRILQEQDKLDKAKTTTQQSQKSKQANPEKDTLSKKKKQSNSDDEKNQDEKKQSQHR